MLNWVPAVLLRAPSKIRSSAARVDNLSGFRHKCLRYEAVIAVERSRFAGHQRKIESADGYRRNRQHGRRNVRITSLSK